MLDDRSGLVAAALLALLLSTPPTARATPPSPPRHDPTGTPAGAVRSDAGGQPTADAEATDDAEKPAKPAGKTVASPHPLTLSEKIVVTANRLDSPAETVGSSVTVLGREEIERRHETSVLELLRTVPGLEVSQAGPGTVASVFLRGGNSNHTLVLVDGMRGNNATTGAFDFSALPADGIERIEVLRGPQSTLYGSEAMGGVISIRTQRGAPGLHAGADARTGSYGTRGLELDVSGGRGRLDYSVSSSDRHTDGFSVASERLGNTENDPFSRLAAVGRLGIALPREGRAELLVRRVHAVSALDGFEVGVGPVDDPNFEQTRDLTQASFRFEKPLAPWWHQHLEVGMWQDASLGEDPDTPFNNFDIRSRVRRASWQSDFEPSESDTVTVGVARERREGENRGAYRESAVLSSAFVQNHWAWRDRLFLTVGLRRDHHSVFGGKTTYRGTAAYLFPRTGVRLHGSFGTGFRAPSFDELAFPFAGNRSLRPETSEGMDLGVDVELAGGAASLGATYYRNHFADLIVFDLATFGFDNVLRARSQGVEVTARVRPVTRLELEGSYTLGDSEDETTGLPLARRPRHRATVVAIFEPASRWRGTASLVAVADRIDSDGRTMDDYERLDVGVDYAVTPALHPYLEVRNLLDRRYEEVSGFTSARRSVFVGLRVGR